MDDTNITSAGQISSLLLGHLLSSTTSTACAPTSAPASSSPFQNVPHHHWGRQMPFSSFTGVLQTGAAPTTQDAAGAVPLGFDPAVLLHGSARMGAPAVDLDPSYDAESEEGAEVSEERPKPPPPRSGSKRSRAAEVHNLSEKRRRSRINEKMKALQNLIPNSNKTDKASMLDEAIEYLKQLQLQVQMLSMRNGLSLQSMYLPSTLQALQASQVRLGLGIDNASVSNMGVGMAPAKRDSSSQSSFEMSKHPTTSHEHMIPIAAIGNAATSFGMEASPFQHGSFPFPVPTEGTYKEDVLRHHRQLGSGHVTRNMSNDAMKSLDTAASVLFEGQASPLMGANHLEACMLSCGRSDDVVSRGQEHQALIQHLHSFQTGRGASSDDVKTEMLEFR